MVVAEQPPSGVPPVPTPPPTSACSPPSGGKLYRDDILKLAYDGRSIHDVLEMTVADALPLSVPPRIRGSQTPVSGAGMQPLVDVGVGFLRLGQSLSTLSGGEAQCLKLAAEPTRTATSAK